MSSGLLRFFDLLRLVDKPILPQLEIFFFFVHLILYFSYSDRSILPHPVSWVACIDIYCGRRMAEALALAWDHRKSLPVAACDMRLFQSRLSRFQSFYSSVHLDVVSSLLFPCYMWVAPREEHNYSALLASKFFSRRSHWRDEKKQTLNPAIDD